MHNDAANPPSDEDVDFILPDSQQEDEDDLSRVSFHDAVVTSADWTIESINMQMEKGNIDIHPGFQRRSAWDITRKSRLIESIIVGMPVPNVVLAENKDHKGRFIVIDGKQRLLAINEFIESRWALRGLDLRPELNGEYFHDLRGSDREQFENSTLRSTLIKNWRDENFLYAAFFRLNSGSLPLSPQELRKALIGGHLIDVIEDYLVHSEPYQRIFGHGLDKRMRDSELVLRFFAFDDGIEDYRGDFKNFLDETTQHYEDHWGNLQVSVERKFHRLDLALDTSHKIFDRNVFRKWLPHVERFERVVNRAVFDCIVRYFSQPVVATKALSVPDKVVDTFKAVCEEPIFRNSIERSTKTVDATRTRLALWGASLADTIGMQFDDQRFVIG